MWKKCIVGIHFVRTFTWRWRRTCIYPFAHDCLLTFKNDYSENLNEGGSWGNLENMRHILIICLIVCSSVIIFLAIGLHLSPSRLTMTPKPIPFRLKDNFESLEKRIVEHGNIESPENGSLRNWIMEMESKYKKINDRIQSVCSGYDHSGKFFDQRELNIKIMKSFLKSLFSIKYRIGYCRQAKVGTSTWLAHLSLLTEHPEKYRKMIVEQNVEKLHLEVTPEFDLEHDDVIDLWNNFENSENVTSTIRSFNAEKDILHFSFVRHPFERLVSCYRDKVRGSSNIHSTFIKAVKGLEFPQFIDYVIKSFRTKNCVLNPFCPVNIHWKPQISRCHYCDIPYKRHRKGRDVSGRRCLHHTQAESYRFDIS